MTRALLYIGVVLCLIAQSNVDPIYGATFFVNSPDDSHDLYPGDGEVVDEEQPLSGRVTLRAALEEASALPGPDTIRLIDDTLIIRITKGSLYVDGGGTSIIGSTAFPVVDGIGSLLGTSLFVIRSDSNLISGITIRRSRKHGLIIKGVANVIGGATASERNQFVGCGLDPGGYAIAISGTHSSDNRVMANWIGIHGNGTESYGNRGGLLLDDSTHHNLIGNQIGPNATFITGNQEYGLTIDGYASENDIFGCAIGVNITYVSGEGNQLGGVLINSAHNNRLGGPDSLTWNVISRNGGHGITMSGRACRENQISGNYVGTDNTGKISVANDIHGLYMTDGARDNVIGKRGSLPANLFSGNYGDGIHIRGTETINNVIAGNYVGISASGGGLYAGDTYNYNGITIADGASHNQIGGLSESERNVISSNSNFGLYLEGPGTSYNRVIGNFIGISAWGISSSPNGSGLVIRHGAHDNQIGGRSVSERNIISGNRADLFPFGGGLLIYDAGSDRNIIEGNFIGTNDVGDRALRNGSAGVIIGNGARSNMIGGELSSAGNLISGNGSGFDIFSIGRGIHIYGIGTDHNQILGNIIGLSALLDKNIYNAGHGIGIFNGAQNNQVGAVSIEAGNLIAGNEGSGIFISGFNTESNSFRFNDIFDNDSASIVLRDGAQENITPPRLISASTSIVSGDQAPPNSTVDIYKLINDPAQGRSHIGQGQVSVDGQFEISILLVEVGDSVSAIVTDTMGNSSEFAASMIVDLTTDISELPNTLPVVYALEQNYPNPFNPTTSIVFSLPVPGWVDILLFNTLGQKVTIVTSGFFSAGKHSVEFDSQSHGGSLASGVYFYKISAGSFSATRRMVLVR